MKDARSGATDGNADNDDDLLEDLTVSHKNYMLKLLAMQIMMLNRIKNLP